MFEIVACLSIYFGFVWFATFLFVWIKESKGHRFLGISHCYGMMILGGLLVVEGFNFYPVTWLFLGHTFLAFYFIWANEKRKRKEVDKVSSSTDSIESFKHTVHRLFNENNTNP